MGHFKVKRKVVKLNLGEDYNINYNFNNIIKCKFIQVTKCGFNFLNLTTNKCILKKHLYPSKCINHSSNDWYWINPLLKINKI
jgi:hypothetical protein